MNRKVYRRVAKQYGISVKEVKRELQSAINIAYENPNSFAKSIDFTGEKPTTDEIIMQLTQTAKSECKI